MILTAHQPMYLPWLGLFDKISRADVFCIFDGVQFERHGFGNRNQIKTPDGAQMLTVPLRMKGYRDKTIREMLICNDRNWARKHLRAIELAYQGAPYFHMYYPEFRRILELRWETLTGLTSALLYLCFELLGMEVEVIYASEQGFGGAKSDLVLDMCKKLGATEYIFGALGEGYADVDAFVEAGIQLQFQDYKHPEYPQLHGRFVSHLSIVDLLMNCGPESLRILRNE